MGITVEHFEWQWNRALKGAIQDNIKWTRCVFIMHIVYRTTSGVKLLLQFLVGISGCDLPQQIKDIIVTTVMGRHDWDNISYGLLEHVITRGSLILL